MPGKTQKKKAAKATPKLLTVTLPASGRRLSCECTRKSVKNLNLRVRRDGTVHLSIPRRTGEGEAIRFLQSHEDWLLQAMERMQARTEAHPTLGGDVGDVLPYLGKTLSITWVAGSPAGVEADLEHRCLTIRLPNPMSQELRRAAVEVFEKAETRRLVTTLISVHYPAVAGRGVPFPEHIRVKSLRSRFGSCAPATRSLNFASRLCEYPPAFVEYVVVHELCHFIHPNHSDAFWREVARILPDWQQRDRLGKS